MCMCSPETKVPQCTQRAQAIIWRVGGGFDSSKQEEYQGHLCCTTNTLSCPVDRGLTGKKRCLATRKTEKGLYIQALLGISYLLQEDGALPHPRKEGGQRRHQLGLPLQEMLSTSAGSTGKSFGAFLRGAKLSKTILAFSSSQQEQWGCCTEGNIRPLQKSLGHADGEDLSL